MGRALEGLRDKLFLMTEVCTQGRGKDVAMQQLDESLRRLRTDHLGHLELYKSTMKYDGDLGRGQHGLPSHKELPL